MHRFRKPAGAKAPREFESPPLRSTDSSIGRRRGRRCLGKTKPARMRVRECLARLSENWVGYCHLDKGADRTGKVENAVSLREIHRHLRVTAGIDEIVANELLHAFEICPVLSPAFSARKIDDRIIHQAVTTLIIIAVGQHSSFISLNEQAKRPRLLFRTEMKKHAVSETGARQLNVFNLSVDGIHMLEFSEETYDPLGNAPASQSLISFQTQPNTDFSQ